MKNKYKIYMQEVDNSGNLKENTLKDLEDDFDGLRYSKCEGLNTIGAPKNVYEETYSDANRLRVYLPEEVKNAATTISLTLFFVGDNRYATKDAFDAYISKGLHKYWDTCRKKWFIFYVKDEIKPATEELYGSTPFLKYTYTLQNIYGKTFNVE